MTAITSGDHTVIRISDSESREELETVASRVDGVTVRVGSTGVTGIEPLVMVTRAGQTAFHVRCSPDRLRTVGTQLESSGDPTAGDPDEIVDHEAGTTTLPRPSLPGLGTGERTVLGACGWRRPTARDDHEAAGGFSDPSDSDVFDFGAALRGRGWGDWCQDEHVSETWESVRTADDSATVVVNGHGNAADVLLLASAPFEVLDGATAVADTVGADEVVVYVSQAAERAVDTARTAVENYPDPAVPVRVATGPAAYRAGEPTMAIEAIEGNHRLEARLRPPGPEEVGLNGEPTLVHTPRTLAHLAVALREGGIPETRAVTLSGDVTAPATIEVAESDTLATVLDAVAVEGEFKAACVGGRFGGMAADLDVTVDPVSLADAGLGTEGSVQVLAEDHCVVEFVGKRARFAAEENCGRCVPCREGTTQLADLLRSVYDGEYDRDGIEELVRVMATSSICQFGVDAGRPARTALTVFDAEFEAHADGRCPAGACRDALEVTP